MYFTCWWHWPHWLATTLIIKTGCGLSDFEAWVSASFSKKLTPCLIENPQKTRVQIFLKIIYTIFLLTLDSHTNALQRKKEVKFRIPSPSMHGVSLLFFHRAVNPFWSRAPRGVHQGTILLFFSLVSAHMALAFISPPHECHCHNLQVQQRRCPLRHTVMFCSYTWPVSKLHFLLRFSTLAAVPLRYTSTCLSFRIQTISVWRNWG
jgi:hypothetical protein